MVVRFVDLNVVPMMLHNLRKYGITSNFVFQFTKWLSGLRKSRSVLQSAILLWTYSGGELSVKGPTSRTTMGTAC